MKEIKNRDDISLLVHSFYNNIRKDDLLGPIFNQKIPTEHWPQHLEKLTDFWETNLLGVQKFKGNPSLKHLETDRFFNFTIQPTHFEHWLKIWTLTIDSLFDGDLAIRAKMAAFNIAKIQMAVISRNKPNI